MTDLNPAKKFSLSPFHTNAPLFIGELRFLKIQRKRGGGGAQDFLVIMGGRDNPHTGIVNRKGRGISTAFC